MYRANNKNNSMEREVQPTSSENKKTFFFQRPIGSDFHKYTHTL